MAIVAVMTVEVWFKPGYGTASAVYFFVVDEPPQIHLREVQPLSDDVYVAIGEIIDPALRNIGSALKMHSVVTAAHNRKIALDRRKLHPVVVMPEHHGGWERCFTMNVPDLPVDIRGAFAGIIRSGIKRNLHITAE